MGGSGSEYKEKRKNREGADDSQVERKSKRSITEEERESRRSDKKKKKHSKRRSDQEKKKSKDIRKGKHHSIGSDPHCHSKAKCEELSKEDYFSKNNEFATWLKDERNVFFSDLSSESAREFFSDFVKEWNNQKLESRYYEGIASGPRTSHNWKIKSQR